MLASIPNSFSCSKHLICPQVKKELVDYDLSLIHFSERFYAISVISCLVLQTVHQHKKLIESSRIGVSVLANMKLFSKYFFQILFRNLQNIK